MFHSKYTVQAPLTRNNKRLHPNGMRFIPVRAVRHIYRNPYDISRSAYGWVQYDTLVTPEQVEGAIDVVGSQPHFHAMAKARRLAEVDRILGISAAEKREMTRAYHWHHADLYEPRFSDFY